YDNSHSQIIKNRHSRQIDALRMKANLCTQQEALGTSPSEQQLKEISLQWDSIELLNVEFSRRIEARRDMTRRAIDRVAVGAERRMLCIQLEIAMGIESPAEDKALRMQYQLEQMKEYGLGQESNDRKELLENLELEWLFMPGAEVEQQQILDERFQRVLRSA
ncbi:MAG: hypothetical protein GY935_26705, partial [Gammaproteobacteria bacterium]|nr:hypothetical protein [Gammaproteobacteria bacterium]